MPNILVVMASGYTHDANIAAMEADGLEGFIHKPYKAVRLKGSSSGSSLPGTGRFSPVG